MSSVIATAVSDKAVNEYLFGSFVLALGILQVITGIIALGLRALLLDELDIAVGSCKNKNGLGIRPEGGCNGKRSL